MVLSFKPQFVKPILEGTKIHTIRQDEHDRWKAGNKIHMATGVRTPDYCMFKMDKCVSVQRIEIFMSNSVIFIDGNYFSLMLGHQEDLFKNDGFHGREDFFKFFKQYPADPFRGKIIHWTDFRY